MMYLSKGIINKGKNKQGLYIRHFGQPEVLHGAEADMWRLGRYGFVHVYVKPDITIAEELSRKGVAVFVRGSSELDKYDALCKCAICANPKLKFSLTPLSATEKRILTWLKKSNANLSLPELISLEEKDIEPKKYLRKQNNPTELLKIIYPGYDSLSGDLELRMKRSIYRIDTVDAVIKLLRKKRIVLM